MRNIEKILFHGSAYTFFLMIIYFIFASLNTESPTVSLTRFLLISLLGFIIAAAEFLYAMTELKGWLRRLIHYAVILIAFCLISVFGGFIESRGPQTVIALIIIYTAFYFAVFGVAVLIQKSLAKADDKMDKSIEKRAQKAKEAKEKNQYKPRFK